MFKEYLLMLDKNKLSYELIDIDINGNLLKKAVIHIKEKNAYSFFKNEKGLHINPLFDDKQSLYLNLDRP